MVAWVYNDTACQCQPENTDYHAQSQLCSMLHNANVAVIMHGDNIYI